MLKAALRRFKEAASANADRARLETLYEYLIKGERTAVVPTDYHGFLINAGITFRRVNDGLLVRFDRSGVRIVQMYNS